MTGPVIEARALSKWYGEVIGLNGLELNVHPGITGMVGPNGSGKSTFFKLVSGLIKPSVGTIRVLGEDPWGNIDLHARVGLCPDYDNLNDEHTARYFLKTVGGLHGMSGSQLDIRIDEVFKTVGMTEAADRRIGGFSKGMRQRMKIAGAMLHEPELLMLDEPLSGTDPLGRNDIIDLVHELHRDLGHHVIVSSHVLHEVERLTDNVVVVYKGRAVATGHIREIRDLIDQHPHNIVVEADKLDTLVARFVRMDSVVSVYFASDRSHVVLQVTRPDEFFNSMPGLIRETGANVTKMYSKDDDLESVFRYLVGV
ncbi:MAG: ABC transporter ATP-binding protein [Thermoplasmata archaeon]|nr:MAG: ABC transporter ATP-binding protein [Thermoplasmata archaeon]